MSIPSEFDRGVLRTVFRATVEGFPPTTWTKFEFREEEQRIAAIERVDAPLTSRESQEVPIGVRMTLPAGGANPGSTRAEVVARWRDDLRRRVRFWRSFRPGDWRSSPWPREIVRIRPVPTCLVHAILRVVHWCPDDDDRFSSAAVLDALFRLEAVGLLASDRPPASSALSTMSAAEQVRQRVDALAADGFSRHEAHRRVMIRYPELREAFVREQNEEGGQLSDWQPVEFEVADDLVVSMERRKRDNSPQIWVLQLLGDSEDTIELKWFGSRLDNLAEACESWMCTSAGVASLQQAAGPTEAVAEMTKSAPTLSGDDLRTVAKFVKLQHRMAEGVDRIEAVLCAVADNPSEKPAEIADAIELKGKNAAGQVTAILSQLHKKAGIVNKTPGARYHLDTPAVLNILKNLPRSS